MAGPAEDPAPPLSLNRTSVGLKPETPGIPVSSGGPPQSNQRGIETAESGDERFYDECASIEPAWD